MSEIRLDTERGCLEELQRCSNAIASLIHRFTIAVEERAVIEHGLARDEAIATVEIADSYPKITATEMKDRVTNKLLEKDQERMSQKVLNEAAVTSLSARIRALEKRMSAAQSSLNQHQAEARSAGLAGR